MTLPPTAAGPPILIGQACAAAALQHSTLRADEASKAATLARDAAEEAEKSLLPRVRALLSLEESSSSSGPSNHLRVDLGSGVLARAVPVKEKSVILPIGLGFYLESGSDDGNENRSEALDLAAGRVAALHDRAQRAAARASRAREEAEGDTRAALRR